MTQELPKWVENKNRQITKPPTPADVAKAKAWRCSGCYGNVAGSLPRCPVCGNRKPKSALAPKVQPKPKEPEIPRLHIRVELHGSMEFRLEGEQAEEFKALLTSSATADEIIEHLDPWSSGIGVRQEIDVLEDPADKRYNHWRIKEDRGSVSCHLKPAPWGGPFLYTLESQQPDRVDWRQVQ